MDMLRELFSFQMNPWELVLRGSAIYWFLFVLFRFVLRRDVGSIGIADILLLVLIADASQNAMAGPYETVAEGMLLVGTIAGWNLLLDWASYRSKRLRAIVDPPPVVLVRRGRLILSTLRSQLITVPELMSKLREHGIEKLDEVKIARMESDGEVSVIRFPDKPEPAEAAPDQGQNARR
ncbi:DUF421 domain-containing protein [Roseateles violae]|uniref:DUF421 domain-containing protein n=1 Tax=Roseateles violae TaxID=3058042 RepID=A0ABT8DYC5_9BURK|nr:YetF domain-containing protein [Pelomonas sp. PFR6]MDN3922439.1 DUF421 domain-containing protein [Pelomonas sp. PFR6]